MKKIFLAVSLCFALFAQADDDKCYFKDSNNQNKTYYGRTATESRSDNFSGSVGTSGTKFQSGYDSGRTQTVCRDDENPSNTSAKYGNGWTKDEEYENRLKRENRSNSGFRLGGKN